MNERDLLAMSPEVLQILARIHSRRDLAQSHYDELEKFIREQREDAYNKGYADGIKNSKEGDRR